jgi:hypothetical protein
MVPRGLEVPQNDSENADAKRESASEKPPASLGASPNSEQLCFELSEVVSAWPKLSSEIRNAVLTLLRAAKQSGR